MGTGADRPPFELSAATVSLVADIMRLVGRHDGMARPTPQPQLRRGNRIRTVLDSLAIEGNTLSLEQATAILDGKRVVGPPREILEVRNAVRTYDHAAAFDPSRERDLLRAHDGLMRGLVEDAGRYRARGVGIFAGTEVAHVAPPAARVPQLVRRLLSFVARDRTVHALIKSAVVHYEIEFIHPFSDGNGRMGRLWQHVMLVREHPIFEHVPVESAVRGRQAEYYRALGASDRTGASTPFIEFSLETVRDSLAALLRDIRPETQTPETRLARARNAFGRRTFSRGDYLAEIKLLSTATASRDLALGVARKILSRTGDKALARYRFA